MFSGSALPTSVVDAGMRDNELDCELDDVDATLAAVCDRAQGARPARREQTRAGESALIAATRFCAKYGSGGPSDVPLSA